MCSTVVLLTSGLSSGRRAFIGVAELLAVHPDKPLAASYHRSLGNVVDALAERGVVRIDDALEELEDMRRQVKARVHGEVEGLFYSKGPLKLCGG